MTIEYHTNCYYPHAQFTTLLATMLPHAMDRQHLVALAYPQPAARLRLIKYMALVISIVLTATNAMLLVLSSNDPEPYHTSALSGEDWVLELLSGHPERIRCELGVHSEVFVQLVGELRAIGHSNSKFVSLEEQVAIFLYTSVTGLSIRHVGERFQRSNETISR